MQKTQFRRQPRSNFGFSEGPQGANTNAKTQSRRQPRSHFPAGEGGGPNQPYRKSQQKAPQAKILDLLSAFWVPQIRDLRTLQSKNINLRSAAGDFLEV